MVGVGTENLLDSFGLLEQLGHGSRRLVNAALGTLLLTLSLIIKINK